MRLQKLAILSKALLRKEALRQTWVDLRSKPINQGHKPHREMICYFPNPFQKMWPGDKSLKNCPREEDKRLSLQWWAIILAISNWALLRKESLRHIIAESGSITSGNKIRPLSRSATKKVRSVVFSIPAWKGSSGEEILKMALVEKETLSLKEQRQKTSDINLVELYYLLNLWLKGWRSTLLP